MAANPHETPTTHHHRDEAASQHGCFRWPCFGRDEDDSHSYLLRENNESGGPHKEAWYVSNLKKIREFSELVAGPRWKNFIRKMSKICKRGGNNNNNNNVKPTTAQFQYTPESYALNFAGGDREEDADLLHSFSTRFAPGFSGNEQRRRGDNM